MTVWEDQWAPEAYTETETVSGEWVESGLAGF
jgi:hypothetical protein